MKSKHSRIKHSFLLKLLMISTPGILIGGSIIALILLDIQTNFAMTQNMDPELIAYWKFDDSSNSAQAVDSTGYGHSGLVNGPSWINDGKLGGALSFDGVDDVVELGTLDITEADGSSPNAVTISVWIKANDFDVPDARIISKASDRHSNDHWWMLSTNQMPSGNIYLRARLKTDAASETFQLKAEQGSLSQTHGYMLRWFMTVLHYVCIKTLLK